MSETTPIIDIRSEAERTKGAVGMLSEVLDIANRCRTTGSVSSFASTLHVELGKKHPELKPELDIMFKEKLF